MKNTLLNQSSLSASQAIMLNNINQKNKKKFNILLKRIFSATNQDPKWILSPIFSRDFIQSKLFADLNFLNLLDYYEKKKKIKTVLVDNYFLKRIIKKKYPNLSINLNEKSFKNLYRNPKNILISFLKLIFFSLFMFFSKSISRRNNLKKNNIILIETFFHKNLISNGKFNERYNKEVYRYFPSKIKKKSYFFPINLSPLHINKFLKITQKEKIKYLYPLDFLKFKDYINSIFLLINLGGFKFKKIYFDNYDIKKLIDYHRTLSIFNLSSYLASLNFFFLKRMKENNFKINLLIDWYENQIIDKGICLAKNTFYPQTKLKGHMGFINDFNGIHYYTPSLIEKKLNALPDEILVISKKIYLKFFKKIKFIRCKVVPAIRNKNIFKIKEKNKIFSGNKKKLVFILSANHEESDFILNIMSKCFDKNKLQDYCFILKPHSNTKIPSFILNNKNINIYKGDFYEMLSKADIIIAGGTTATIESLILNKKIILIGNKNEITINPLIDYSKKKVKICYDTDSLIKNVNILSKLKKKNMRGLNKKLMNEYFTKMSKKSFNNFLN